MEEQQQQSVHAPVMVEEVLSYLQPKLGGIYLDGTIGAGGHALSILRSLDEGAQYIGLDRDEEILKEAEETLSGYKSVSLYHASYADAPEVLSGAGIEQVDGVLLDLGASSLQFDSPQRGFSFKFEGPLDMRFDVSSDKTTAADILNTYPEEALKKLLREYGEEKFAGRIAKAIVAARKQAPFETTLDLVEVVEASIPKSAWPKTIHPATRTFQALRLEVNQEFETLKTALPELINLLKSGGRIVVISFHSLEDRIVKQAFKAAEKDCICPKGFPVCRCDKKQEVSVLTKKPVKPSKTEINNNPRARSAKLRAAEHI